MTERLRTGVVVHDAATQHALEDGLSRVIASYFVERAPVTTEEMHRRRVQVYRAVAHLLCWRAQTDGLTSSDLSALLRETAARRQLSLGMSSTARAKIAERKGVTRVSEPERQEINRLLASFYIAIGMAVPSPSRVNLALVRALFARFVREHAPQIGMPRDVAIERVETLDLLQRGWGKPLPLIPRQQYGLV